MSTFVLIHGSWHGGWCWSKVVARLEAAGHRALAPDLLGLGRDCTPPNRIALATWRDAVTDLIDQQPEPVVLVGHSRGGAVISEAAEKRPERVRMLVYLCAFLLRDGESVLDRANPSGSLVAPLVLRSPDGASLSLRDDGVREGFYGDCSAEDVVLALSLLRPEPAAPLSTPLRLSEERYGRVPRVYVECLRDRALPIAAQRSMHEALPCRQVLTLDTDHSPFLSRPDELVAHLLTV